MGSEGRPLEYPLRESTTYGLGLSPREELERNWEGYKKLIDKKSLEKERYGFIRFFEDYNPARNPNPHFEAMAAFLSRFQLEIRVEHHGKVTVRQISEKSYSAVIPRSERKPVTEIKPKDLKNHLITIGQDVIVSEGCLLICGYDYFFEFGKPIDPDSEISTEQRWRITHETQTVSLKELGLS